MSSIDFLKLQMELSRKAIHMHAITQQSCENDLKFDFLKPCPTTTHGLKRIRLMQPDSKEVQQLKALIRSSEARSAGRVCGCNTDNLHFLDMPIYETV